MRHLSSSAVLTLSLASSLALAAPPKLPLTLGISQLYGAEQAAKVGPLVEPYLSKALGSAVTVKVFADADELADALAAKQVDLAWVPPLAFVHASQKDPEVMALSKAMRNSALTYRAVLFVKADSPVMKLADLKGKKVSWVAKSSASGYLFARELVRKEGFEPTKLFSAEKFEGDHPAVCKAVKAGSADVGATYASEAADPKNVKVDGCGAEAGDFRVLASTGNVPNEVVAARSDFPPTRINDVLAAFGRMGNTPEGKQVLTDAFRVDGWGVAVEGDFESVLDVVRAQGTKARVAPPQKQDKPEQPAKGGKPGKK